MRDTIRALAFAVLLFYLLPSFSLAQGPAQTAGCGKNATTGVRSIISSDVQRNFSVRLPQGYDPGTLYPVVLGFHGSPGAGVFFELDTRFSNDRWGSGRILVYPDGYNGTWATGFGGTPLEQDLRFISDLLDDLRDNFCVDNERVYATGISNGGGFLNRIACDATVGANFAAFAPDAGAYSGFEAGGNATCNPYKTPIPIISFHGGNDTIVPYGGRNGSLTTPPIEYWLQGWVERNRCDNMTETTTANGTVHRFVWTCDGVQGAMEHYRVDTMGHVWPSKEPNFSQTASGEGPSPIEANDLILEFFGKFNVNVRGDSDQPSGTTGAMPSETSAAGGSAAGRVERPLGMVGVGVAGAALWGYWAW